MVPPFLTWFTELGGSVPVDWSYEGLDWPAGTLPPSASARQRTFDFQSSSFSRSPLKHNTMLKLSGGHLLVMGRDEGVLLFWGVGGRLGQDRERLCRCLASQLEVLPLIFITPIMAVTCFRGAVGSCVSCYREAWLLQRLFLTRCE